MAPGPCRCTEPPIQKGKHRRHYDLHLLWQLSPRQLTTANAFLLLLSLFLLTSVVCAVTYLFLLLSEQILMPSLPPLLRLTPWPSG